MPARQEISLPQAVTEAAINDAKEFSILGQDQIDSGGGPCINAPCRGPAPKCAPQPPQPRCGVAEGK